MVAGAMADVRHDIVAGCRILDGERLTDAFGHLSARGGEGEPDVLITPRVGPGLVRYADELLGATADGEVVAGDPALMPGEAAIHLGLLKARTNIGAVCRFHGAGCMAFSSLGIPLPTTIGIALVFGGPVPVFDTALTVTTPEAAAALAEMLGAGTAVLLRGFGAVTVGPTVAEAVVRATLLERAAQAVLTARMAGDPQVYTQAQADAFVARTAVVEEQLARAWAYFKRRWPPHDD
jgi:ribulose-5-phosphate 4-epimerase/fuculose-1-phosphate aldolase